MFFSRTKNALLLGRELQVLENLDNFFLLSIVCWNSFFFFFFFSVFIKTFQSREFEPISLETSGLFPKPFRNVPVKSIEQLEASWRLDKLGPHLISVFFCQAVGSRETAKQQKPDHSAIAASLNLTYLGYWGEW